MTRVLLVDDHPVVRRGFQHILAEELPDARFAEASSASAALAVLEQDRCEIALVDLNLPDKDGLELLDAIHARYPALPVLVVSGYPEEEFAVRCLRLGALGYLAKETAPEELAKAVKDVLGGRTYVTPMLAEKLDCAVRREVAPRSHDALSRRELQVLRLVAAGRSRSEIAAELSVSQKTISTYRGRIAEKLRISTKVELTLYAVRHKLIQ